MNESKFDFTKFLNQKGFIKISNNKYKFYTDENFELQLEIENGRYILPFTLTENFNGKIPENEMKAESDFKTIEKILEIKFLDHKK